MYYFKKIISYLDYYEYGEKKKNCGYGKIMVKDQEVTVEVHIKGLTSKEGCMCDIIATGKRGGQLGRIVLDRGTGYYNACFHGMDMDGDGLRVFDITGLMIRIDGDRYCETAWEWGALPEQIPPAGTPENKPQKTEAERMVPEEPEEIFRHGAKSDDQGKRPETEEQTTGERPSAEKAPDERESRREPVQENERGNIRKDVPETVREPLPKDVPEKKTTSGDMPLHKSQICDTRTKRKFRDELEDIPLQDVLHEDKWQQLCALYPVCHPFEDGEEYIAIAPKDFVILRKEYQNLVSNSFLLHGFYNYHHVILGKTGEQDMYYIGVPGAYLDREKKVAVMFGFEGFAQSVRGNGTRSGSVSEKGKPVVETGAFGYYMRKVEI